MPEGSDPCLEPSYGSVERFGASVANGNSVIVYTEVGYNWDSVLLTNVEYVLNHWT